MLSQPEAISMQIHSDHYKVTPGEPFHLLLCQISQNLNAVQHDSGQSLDGETKQW